MTIIYSETEASLSDDVCVQEVDALMEWLLSHPEGRINLKLCRHLHLAALQSLMCVKRPVTEWPDDPGLRYWVEPALSKQEDHV
ncbi:MAG: hypothetical protein LRY66_09065 [Saccharospirillaceae bacterium]|nr:hypothetical protein [Saccharospirillaceae bacterium]MCD8531493.1 hypothetical protein [Saccharospirillaceae bacterium]